MSQIEKGSCLCGQYSYEFVREKALSARHCHCRDCQKSTGSGSDHVAMMLQTRRVFLTGIL